MTDDDDEPEAVSSEVPADDAAVEPKAYRAKQRDAEQRDMERAKFWRDVLAGEIGRREIFALLTDAHAFEERFACGPNGFPDPHATFFHAGEQAFGHRLFLTVLKYDRARTLLMLEENDARLARPAPPKRRGKVNG